jgi:Cu/Ag efflux pump CusA
VEDVNQIVETAIGGNTIGTTVEGRERYRLVFDTRATFGMTSIS